ncbi:hypothetical protein CRE_19878 [Caenorhabditis remanei]|uniref:Seven TM Receptor n=1 Tax=Caenorhabditis remanei TaxID=31234 RepID=E3MTG6_CAERE|nr:hypothetical protein CRE_19878 [Caenorhabditis remanei]
MPLEPLSLLTANISRICYVLTVFFNTSLIFLTIKFTKHIVGTYRYMIVTFAIFGIIFSTADILIRPLFHSYNGCLVYFTLGSAFRFSKKASEISMLVYSGVYGLILAFLTVQFVYRAGLLSKSRKTWTRHFDGWKLILWIMYAISIGAAWAFAVTFLKSDDTTNSYLRKMFLSNYGVEISTVANYPILAYVSSSRHLDSQTYKKLFQNEDEAHKTLRWNSVKCIIITTFIMIIHYCIMLICGIYMYQRIKKNFNASSTAHEKLQKQFFHALIYQTAAPTLFFQVPVFVVILAPFFDLKFNFNSSIVVYGLSAYPLVDSLILLKVVEEYKHAYSSESVLDNFCNNKNKLVSGFIGIFVKSCSDVFGEETPRQPPTLTNAIR